MKHIARRTITATSFAAAACMLAFAATTVSASEARNTDLTRFLPNDGNSVFNATGLLRKWPAAGPRQLWRVQIGWGKTAVIETGGRAFTSTQTDGKQWALCLDPHTGKTLWKKLLFDKENRHFVKGPVTSPIADGDRVYFIPYAIYQKDVWEMRCPVICFKSDGTELWRLDKDVWASEASVPLIVGDKLYVGADNPQRVVLAALDKMTGKVIWTTKAESDLRRELAAPASLTYQVVDGVPQVIVGTYGTRELLGVNAETGKIMWRYPYPAGIIIGLVSTPVASGSRLFVCGGEGPGKNFSVCLQMQTKDGVISCKELYRSTELQINNFNTVAIYKGAVFGFGGTGSSGFIHCTELSDGKLLWKETGPDWSKDQQLIIADGLIFALTKNDELVMAQADRTGYHELGRMKLNMDLGRQQHPTIANGRMYIRGLDSVACYQIAAQQTN